MHTRLEVKHYLVKAKLQVPHDEATRDLTYSCISMLRYWSSLRYSSLRTLFLLADELRRVGILGIPRPLSTF